MNARTHHCDLRRISLAFTNAWRAAWWQCSARQASSTDKQLEHKVLGCWAELSDSEAWHSEARHSCRWQRVYQNWRLCTLFDWTPKQECRQWRFCLWSARKLNVTALPASSTQSPPAPDITFAAVYLNSQ